MANYLIIYTDTKNSDTVERWFSSANEFSNDLHKIAVAGNNACYYLANKGKMDATEDGGVFKGYAIDHNRQKITFSGGSEAPDVHCAVGGCYIRLQREAKDIVVGNDLFAQLPMLYFAQNGVVAISDSILVLTEARKVIGLKNSVNSTVALSRAWIHGMASQLLSTSTLIDGISYCPPGTNIRIKSENERICCQIEKVDVSDLFFSTITDYRSTILNCAHKIASLIATFAQVLNSYTVISLSGGTDSRVCLAAALTHSNFYSLYFASAVGKKLDYAVASALAERFHFNFKGLPRVKSIPEKQMSAWFLSCAALYDPLRITGAIHKDMRFYINGVGAEVYKGNFGWRTLSAIKPSGVGHVSAIRPALERYRLCENSGQKSLVRTLRNKIWPPPKVEPAISEAAYQQASQGLLAVGIAPEDPSATEWHYLCFRNAIHSGRHTMYSLLGACPLLLRELVALSRSNLNPYPSPKAGAPSIVTDLMIALTPELAAMPFDDPKKNMSAEYVAERSKFFGRVENIEPYFISGTPNAVHSGTPDMFFRLATVRGFLGEITPASLKQQALRGFECIPHEIRQMYNFHRYIVENEFPEQLSQSTWHNMAATKMMAFLLAD